MKVAAIGDNCIDLYEKLNKYYATGNAVDFAVNMKKLGIIDYKKDKFTIMVRL